MTKVATTGTIYENIYEGQEKHVKYTSLLANCVILDNTIEMSAALNALAKEGCVATIDELSSLSPYQTRHIKRFGNYEIDFSVVPTRIDDELTFILGSPSQATQADVIGA